MGPYGTIPAADEEPGRDEALDVLFRRHYAGLVRLAFCLVGDRVQSEDIVQDAFVALYRHWSGLRDREAAVGYLRSAVLNRSRSRLRVLVRDRRAPLMGLVDVQPEDVPERAVTLVRGSRLLRAVRGLPRRQREVVVCRYYLELSQAETAQALGISVGSVKRHAHRAITALMVSMEDSMDESMEEGR